MIFKPRIFISSTLSENLEIRSDIEKFFSSVGAEAMLYEKNLTPSVNIMTYRKDILDADFIIFIIKNEYGARTERGISGTHEEFQIAIKTDIPTHVYIKLEKEERDAEELIKEIDNNQISFYYFKSDDDLLTRIKETTFTIAKDIMLRKIENASLPEDTIKKISVKHDYEKALDIIRIIDSMKRMNETTMFGWVDSDIFSSYMGPVKDYIDSQEWVFVDRKLEELLKELLIIFGKYHRHGCDSTLIFGSDRTFKDKVLGEVMLHKCTFSSDPYLSRDEYLAIISEFFYKYKELKYYISNMKLIADTL